MRYIILILFFVVFLDAKSKVALLIGNTDYKFQPLANPINDVRAIQKTLIEIGFKKENVTVLENASQYEIKNALYLFSQKATKSEIALVYFSGHGMQVNNSNYMFPANTTATRERDLIGLVDLNLFIDSASSARYGIILIDACRTNPLVKYFQNEQYNTSGQRIVRGKKGLGQVNVIHKKREFIIGFATSAGNTADDGSDSNNSPYAKALIKNLKLNLEIRKVLGQVGEEVNEKHLNQTPIVRYTLGKNDVCLTGSCNEGGGEEGKVEIINGIMYQNQPFQKRYTWNQANNYCESLVLNGYTDWKLPSINQLKNLIPPRSDLMYSKKKGLKVRKEFQKNMEISPFDSAWFWSLTEFERDEKLSWFIRFSGIGATDDYMNKTRKLYVMCARDK